MESHPPLRPSAAELRLGWALSSSAPGAPLPQSSALSGPSFNLRQLLPSSLPGAPESPPPLRPSAAEFRLGWASSFIYSRSASTTILRPFGAELQLAAAPSFLRMFRESHSPPPLRGRTFTCGLPPTSTHHVRAPSSPSFTTPSSDLDGLLLFRDFYAPRSSALVTVLYNPECRLGWAAPFP